MQQEKKKLGMFDIYSLGVGGTIGSGIFVMMGLGIAYTGRSLFLAVACGCLYMTLVYLYQPIMASMFVLPGGDYDMKAMLFTPTLTGVSGIFTFISSFSMAMYATSIVDYLTMVFPQITPYGKLVAVLIFVLFFGSTIKGSKFVATLSNIMTVVLLISICLFVVVGLPKVDDGFLASEGFLLNGFTGFIQAISIMSMACMGTTMTPVSMMTVTKKPRRTIPIAIVFITITVALIYGLMGVVAAGVLPVEDVAGQNLAVVAKAIFSPTMYSVFILGGAVFAIATSLLAAIAMLRYPCYRVAEDGWLPPVFAKTTKNGYPYMIQGLFFLLSILPIFLDFSLSNLVSLGTVPGMLMVAYLDFALIKLVKDYPDQWKNSIFHMPTPIFNIVCIVAAGCALVVSYTLAKTMDLKAIIFCVIFVLACVAIAVYRLKTGAVSKDELLAKRETIAAEALNQTKLEMDETTAK